MNVPERITAVVVLGVAITVGAVYHVFGPPQVLADDPDAKGKCVAAASHEIVCTPTDDQLTRLQLAQARAQTARVQLDNVKLQEQMAQRDFQARLGELDSVATAVRAENKWAATVTMNMDTLRFTDGKGPATHAGEGGKKP